MATGLTKKHWQNATEIVVNEKFASNTDYEICYPGKTPVSDIITQPYESSYKSLYKSGENNKLFYGDNLDVMRFLLQSSRMTGKVKLVYIDPPYGTNSIFQTRGQRDSYRDDLIGSHYIEFMRRRLVLLKELLSNEGSIYVHLDNNMTSQIKLIMDEVFGAKNFRGFISRKKCSNKNSTKNTYGNITDYILFYSKTDNFTWHRATISWSEAQILKEYPCIDEATGRRFKKVPIHAPGVRNGETGKPWRGMQPPPGKHWQFTPEKLDELDANNEIYWSSNGNPRRKVFLDMDKGIPVQDIWLDVQDSLNQNIKTTGYPTEKNPELLKRIIEASSNEGDLVMDCFSGSGTTLSVAEELGRYWIGIDNSSEAITCILKRLLQGAEQMGDYVTNGNMNKSSVSQLSLFEKAPLEAKTNNPRHKFEFLGEQSNHQILTDIINAYIR